MARTILDLAYCCAWLSVCATIYRTRWFRIAPWFAAWCALSAVQAVSVTLAGSYPSPAFTLHWWAPVEVLALACLLAATVILAGVWFACLGVFAAAAAFSMPTGHPLWYALLLEFRGSVWLAVAVSLTAWAAWRLRWPVNLKPATYRAGALLAVFAWLMVTTGSIPPSYRPWLNARFLYRAGAIVLCCRWVMLAPRMRTTRPC